MAKGKKLKRRVRPGTRRRGSMHMLVLAFSFVAIGLLVFAPSALVVYFVGMTPTAVAILIDRDPQKNAAISVAAMNFAGVSPYLAQFIFGNASFSRALELVSDVFVLVVIFGAAAAGWVLIIILPPMIAVVLAVMSESKIQTLRKEQRKLIEEWGDGVTHR